MTPIEQEDTVTDPLRAALDSAVEEFESILWNDIWHVLEDHGERDLAGWSRKYVAYLKDDLDTARAALAADSKDFQVEMDAAQTRSDHEATHGEAEMCGAECIAAATVRYTTGYHGDGEFDLHYDPWCPKCSERRDRLRPPSEMDEVYEIAAEAQPGLDVEALGRAFSNAEATSRARRHSGSPLWATVAAEYARLTEGRP